MMIMGRVKVLRMLFVELGRWGCSQGTSDRMLPSYIYCHPKGFYVLDALLVAKQTASKH